MGYTIINETMEESLVIRKKGGGCIVKQPPRFSSDSKYVYVLNGVSISVYSVQTGDCTHQFMTEPKEDLVCYTIFKEFLIAVSPTNSLSVWNLNEKSTRNIQRLNLRVGATIVALFPVTSQVEDAPFNMVLVTRGDNKEGLSISLDYMSKKHLGTNLYTKAEDTRQSVSASNYCVASFNKDRLTVVSLTKGGEKFSTLAGNGRRWTVVMCEPQGMAVAAGDNTGRILVWPQPLYSSTKSVYHWHSLPVSAITFSSSGSYIYSGAGEGVMVRWNLEAPNVRNFLPRLPAPILHLAVSPDNQYVAIATEDNGIQLADTQFRVSRLIQRLSWGVQGATMFPAGLLWDPRSRSIVLNSRPGHLQFFNTDDNKLLYNLDIAGQNYLAPERHKELVNAVVTHVGISHDGKWMVTVETRDDENTFLETLLKFWLYKFNSRQFSLNTCIQRPHQGRVNTIRFQPPCSQLPDQYLLLTTGTDYKFRIWVPSLYDSIHSEGLRWVCDCADSYRGLPAGCAAFSSDGSVLGVTFRASLTLWDTDTCQLESSLTRDNDQLKAIEFGREECCHLVVAAGEHNLSVWSILTLSVMWTVPLHVSLLCTDLLSSAMAVFTSDNSLFVFKPSNHEPLYEKRNVCSHGGSVFAAIFVPRLQKLMDASATWCGNSQLHFIDSNQELQYLELKSEQDPEGLKQCSSPGLVTPFSVLAAELPTSAVQRQAAASHVQFGTSADAAVRDLLMHPAHTMPHIQLFCVSFLKALTITRESDNVRKMDMEEVCTVRKLKNKTKRKKKRNKTKLKQDKHSKENGMSHLQFKEITETRRSSSKKKQKRRTSMKKDSFSIEDLNSDWLNVLENR